jgi:CheY-like chemotaxis protein
MKTILVLEDQAPVMGLFRLVLQEAGYDLIETDCAEQAIERSAQSGGAISLIIADITQPCFGHRRKPKTESVDSIFENPFDKWLSKGNVV